MTRRAGEVSGGEPDASARPEPTREVLFKYLNQRQTIPAWER